MPQTKFQRMVFAFLTVVVTVHAFVFFNLYVVEGLNIAAISSNGGVPMFGKFMPIWAVILIEFAFAFTLENLIGSPCSFKLACKVFDMKSTHPVLFETAIICATVGLMCPMMSFVAAWIYYPYAFMEFNIFTLLANFLKLVCFNFPFAFFTQLFFIQPLIRTVFKSLFKKSLSK